DRPPMVASLSPSSMATWRQCPRRFFYEKIMRIETETAEPAVCGSFVHLVLEHLMGRPPLERTTEAARLIAGDVWPAFIADPESRFSELALDGDAIRAFKHRAWAGITGYFSIEDPTAVEVVGTEQEVRAELGGAPVYGIIDRIDQGAEGLVVTDYKSGKAPAWQDERDEKLGQLRTYAAMLEANGRPVSELRLLFVSPQISATAKAERCEAEAAAATGRLVAGLPGQPDGAVTRGLLEVETARRTAWETAADRDSARSAADAAAEAVGWQVAERLAGAEGAGIHPLLLDVLTARRKAFFAKRAALRTRPSTVRLRVRGEDLDLAHAEAGGIWAEATACYEAWEFPGRTGPLCDWCPFAQQCDAFQTWDAAGRPGPTPA
ncbi:MAG TPA: PD-(D/E)XK nuclease family protein, partial [Acidimicrobiales bacterium]|nr:PD-(D/E)XK nuclease family protein [Acidimicrobiales bacterium]